MSDGAALAVKGATTTIVGCAGPGSPTEISAEFEIVLPTLEKIVRGLDLQPLILALPSCLVVVTDRQLAPATARAVHSGRAAPARASPPCRRGAPRSRSRARRMQLRSTCASAMRTAAARRASLAPSPAICRASADISGARAAHGVDDPELGIAHRVLDRDPLRRGRQHRP